MSARSPIDPLLLGPVLAPTLGTSRTLPAEAYTSQEVFDWEVEHFFEGGWVCVGRAEEVAAPGDQKAFRIGDEGILVVRDLEGTLRGFYNTCRHRGHELLEPGASRNLNAIKCPYHAWVYRLDGSLGAAPRFGDLEGFDKAEYPLIAARIHEWHGWIFVNPDGGAPPFEAYAGNLDERALGVGAGAPVRRREPRLRDRGELEDDHRELPRVLPLPVDPPRALRGDAPRLGRELRARRPLGGRHPWS